MNLTRNIAQLLQDIGRGQMMSTAYDTAWVARLAKTGEPQGVAALEWLRERQLPDGSWGTESPRYYHDRLVCTLAAAIALATNGHERDRSRLERAKNALETVIPSLEDQATIETIGFELIIPTLFDEAVSLGIVRQRHYSDMERLNRQRDAKLAALPGGVINRYVTLAFSAEMAGPDVTRLLDIEKLQESNGSVGHSPSATAYFLLNVDRRNSEALDYFHQLPVDDGGVPDVVTFDVFERAWTLWNLSTGSELDDETLSLCQPHLDFLQRAWKPGSGVGFAAGYSPKDGDDTSVTFEVLSRFGRPVGIDAVLSYKVADYFRSYALEANPAVSANIHVLSALREAGLPAGHPSVQKIVRFLHAMQFWFDKWHVSPYYPTSHAIIACAGYLDDLVTDSISWMLATQNEDGSWGYYMPTAEETAYCLKALTAWRHQGHAVSEDVLKRGYEWLSEHSAPPYPPLWMGKCLYCPVLVVRSTILSTLVQVLEELGERIC